MVVKIGNEIMYDAHGICYADLLNPFLTVLPSKSIPGPICIIFHLNDSKLIQ